MKVPSYIVPTNPGNGLNPSSNRPNLRPNNDSNTSPFSIFAIRVNPPFLSHELGDFKRSRRRSYHISSSWDPHDDLLLRHLKERQKLSWKDIASHFPYRTVNACQFRWRRLTSGTVQNSDVYEVHTQKETSNSEEPNQPLEPSLDSSDGWAQEEDNLLLQSKDLSFDELSKLLPHKTDLEIKSRILSLVSNKYSSSNNRAQASNPPNSNIYKNNNSLMKSKPSHTIHSSTVPTFPSSTSFSPSSTYASSYSIAASPVRYSNSLPINSVSALSLSPSSSSNSPSPGFINTPVSIAKNSLPRPEPLKLSLELVPAPIQIQTTLPPLKFPKLTQVPSPAAHSTAIRSGLNNMSKKLPSLASLPNEYTNGSEYTDGSSLSYNGNLTYGEPIPIQENLLRSNSLNTPNGPYTPGIPTPSSGSIYSYQSSDYSPSSFVSSPFVTTPYATTALKSASVPLSSYLSKSSIPIPNTNKNIDSYFSFNQTTTNNSSFSASGSSFSSYQEPNRIELPPIQFPPTPSALDTRKNSFVDIVNNNSHNMKLPAPVSGKIITATDYNVSNYTGF